MNNTAFWWVKIHPATVHFPIAFLLLASASGLLYLYGRRHPWLIVVTWGALGLGWIGAGLAILSGLLAQRSLPPDAPYLATLNRHVTSGLTLWLLYAGLIYWRWLHQSRQRRAQTKRPINKTDKIPVKIGASDPVGLIDLLDVPSARWGLSALLLIGALLIVLSGWSGGQLVFDWGVNVRLGEP